jgi:hypothetical protein
MAQFEKFFVKTVFRNTGGFLPGWPIGRPVKLGDVIALRYRRMEYLGNLADPDIGITIIPGEDTAGDDMKWQSKNSVSVTVKIAGEAPLPNSRLTQADAGLTLEFSKGGGFLFEPRGLRFNRIENLVTVRKEAISKLTSQMFGALRIYIIKEVGIIDSYALTISQSVGSKLEVSAEGKSSLSTKDLASLDLDLKIRREELLDFNSVGTKGGTIFFKGEKIKLRTSMKDEIVRNYPAMVHSSDDALLSKVSIRSINSRTAASYFDFADIGGDDIDQLLGETELA